jgi:aryl-alcohol dehydrogenase
VRIEAAVTNEKGAAFMIESLELADPQPHEVLVRVAAAGICHTDLIVRDQWYPVPLPAVLGHEGAGVVQKVGSAVTALVVGDRVAMSFGSCGACPTCQMGRPSYCHRFFEHNFAAQRPDGTTALSRDGQPIHSHFFGQSSFATHAIATERNVVKLADNVPFELVGPFGCGIQTGAGAIFNAIRPPAGSSIVVFGVGTVGLAAIMAAHITGATTIIAVDVKPARLRLARDLGATHAIDAGSEDAQEAIARITGAGVDFALETTGVAQVLRTAVESTGPTGVTGVIGAPAFGTEVTLDVNTILVAGRSIRGIVEGDSVPNVFIPRLIELWRQGRFPAEQIISTYDFDQIDTAATDSAAGTVIKAVVRM